MAGLDGLSQGLDVDELDQFRLDVLEAKAPEVPLDKKRYYPDQVYLADLIMARIKLILEKRHQPSKTLDDFDKFEYQIFTARFKMLQSQTVSRLCDPHSDCLPPEKSSCSQKERHAYAKDRVHLYDTSSYKGAFRDLELRVRQEPRTLFLIICDEAHWGVADESAKSRDNAQDNQDKLQQQNANFKMVNTWNSLTHPNAFVLLVTATPYVLLSRRRLIPWDYIHRKEGTIEVVDTIRRTLRHHDADLTPLNILSWMEAFQCRLAQGLVTKLKVFPPHTEPMKWLQVDFSDTTTSHFLVHTTSNSDEATQFHLKGVDEVYIRSADGRFQMGVLEGQLAFKRVEIWEEGSASKFEIQSQFGMDLIGIKVLGHGLDLNYVRYDDERNTLVLCSNPAATDRSFVDVFVDRPIDTLFMLDDYFQEEQCGPGTIYISLNRYYNSMREADSQKQLIRRDHVFVEMCRKKKKVPTATLR